MPAWRLVLGLLAAGGYALLSHGLMLHAADRPWAVAALLGPLLAAGLGLALRRREPWLLAALALCAAALAALVWHGGAGDLQRLYVAQHAGVHLALFATFAATLRAGRPSLIETLACRVHGGTLSPAMAAYTRGVTRLWAGYFLGMAAVSVAVYAACDWRVWSLLANLVTPLAIGALFVGEYLLRYRLHPEFERSSLAAALGAWRQDAVRR